jgi:hypothetical protein
MERFARIGAGWIATCLLGGFIGLIAAISGWGIWWAAPLGGLAVIVMVIGLAGLGTEIWPWVSGRRRVNAALIRELTHEGHQRLEANADLKAGVPDAEQRGRALRLWMERWERRVEIALAGDSETAACFGRSPNTAGMHWIEVPVQQLAVKLECLQPHIGGSLSGDAVLAEPAAGVGKASSPTAKMSDAIQAQITRGASNPGANEVNWTTEGQRGRHIHLDFKPRALRFFHPVDATITTVPAAVNIGEGQVIVTRFFDAGFMVDEVGTMGDVVRVEPYRD